MSHEAGTHKSPPVLANSPAFREASLRSETRRVYIVIGVIALIFVFLLRRRGTAELDVDVQLAGYVGIGVLLVLQLVTLAFIRRARRRERGLPGGFEVATLVIEMLVPTGMILAHVRSGALTADIALLTPPVLGYGLMISLSTLRLRPKLCLLSGVVCAGGYGGMLLYTTRMSGDPLAAGPMPPAAYGSNLALILISGIAAAWVARELRGHMEAALGEAETRRQVERMEQDLAIAQTIQRALLPRAAPDVPGYDIAGWNRPADETGGDYYDWQSLPDGNWIITLADVCGHGVGPALVTAACRAYVRASGAHHRDLGSLTAHVNRLLADDLPGGRFVTMVNVVIDRSGGPVALLSAGHGPIALYIGQTGDVQDILAQGMPLAIMPDVDFGPAMMVNMAAGDVLALVTDGFVEWARPGAEHNGRGAANGVAASGARAASSGHSAGGQSVASGVAEASINDEASGGRAAGNTDAAGGEQFGIDRLRESLKRHARLPAAAMIEAITADVMAFARGAPQQDDLTMVIVKRVA